MSISLSKVSNLFQNGHFLIFGGQFCYHSNGKSEINSRLLRLGYCSNKSVRRYLLTTTFVFIPQREGAQIAPFVRSSLNLNLPAPNGLVKMLKYVITTCECFSYACSIICVSNVHAQVELLSQKSHKNVFSPVRTVLWLFKFITDLKTFPQVSHI